MSKRLHVYALLVLLAGCNLILPSVPDGTIPGTDAAGDAAAPVDTWRPHDSLWKPDFNPGPDSQVWPDTPPTGDAGDDLVTADGGEDVVVPPLWECQTPIALLSPTIETGSFTRCAQQAVENFIYIYYSLCGVEEPISGPELGWFLQVDQVATLGVEVACEGVCWAYLMKDGCNYQNIQTCWNPQETPVLSGDVRPGTWYVAVEQMEFPGTPTAPGWVGPPFDVHVALNRTHAHPGCAADGALPLSEVLETGTCELQGDTGWRLWSHAGTLPSPGYGADRAWLPCIAGATPVDPLGGMPEYILRVDAYLSGPARRVDITATLDPGARSGIPGWAGILGLAGPPCGETATLVDCDGGQKKELRIPDVTLLPGQEAFLYLDGVGDEALANPIDRSYRIDVRVEDPDCGP